MKKELLVGFSSEGREIVSKAIELAEKYHGGDKRLNGDPKTYHCLATGLKIKEIGFGPKTISAAILHDVLKHEERKEEYRELISKKLGEDVLELVEESTSTKADSAEKTGEFTDLSSIQKYILSSVKDIRTVIIKLADKHNNLLTLEPLPKKDQERFLNEMEKIYIPLSELLGLGSIHKELSDLFLKNTKPNRYTQIKGFMKDQRKISDQAQKEIIEELNTVCDIESVEAEVQGRTKSISSIAKKQKKYEKEGKPNKLDNILDVIAFRIITKTMEDCYKVRSLLTNLYDEIAEESDDYIANPKPNGYRAIHLCLKHQKRGILEIQILTRSMHFYNELGPASHIAYKKSGKRNAKSSAEFDWVKQVHEERKDPDSAIKADLFTDQIFAFTPDSDIVQLPKGSTPLDFAYRVHTRLGNQCVGVMVNGKATSLDEELKTGDIVEIRIDKNKKFASEDWVDLVTTESAKRKIKTSLGKKRKSQL